jgi:hypothetical protein
MLEIAKILVSLLGGALGGALLSEWFRRTRSRVQAIPLIERVNRLVSLELEGITLARIVTSSKSRQLEEVKNLREYQLTMRNTSSIHLQNAEVQFEFPAEDVQAVAERPAKSKTALVQVHSAATLPWRKAIRWKIPHLPSGDSVEFTFQAVDPSSDKYEAALYQCDGVVLERIVGEPPPKKRALTLITASLLYLLGVLLLIVMWRVLQSSGEKLSTIKLAGCDLQVVSLFGLYGEHLDSPFRIKYRIVNVGAQNCAIQSEKMSLASPVSIKPGETLEKEKLSGGPPKLDDVEISVGPTSTSLTKTTVRLYAER